MLVEFSVANFKSIKQKQTLSLVAAPIVSKDEHIDENNVFKAPDKLRLLKTIAIYGANGGGKSNMVKALLAMMHFIDKSFQDENQVGRFEPFLLDHAYVTKPIHFELIFLVKKNRYRYGFEITERKITAEWLFGPAKKNEVAYFTRERDTIQINKTSFGEAESLTDGKTRSTTLFLNVVHAFNGSISREIKDYLKRSFLITSGTYDMPFTNISRDMLATPRFKQQILQLLKAADFGIGEIDAVVLDQDQIPPGISQDVQKKIAGGEKYRIIRSGRMLSGKQKNKQNHFFPFDQFESEGTKKFFSYAGPIIDTLLNGYCLVIDELDARLHPSLTRRIVQLFNSPEDNPKNAQLIFVTHDTNLLDPSLMRRDQIYFAEKNKAGESVFYSLVNIGGVRNDASLEKDYIKGKYGAIPFLGDFNIQ